ncbi:hypothetical protein AUP40_22045 [Thalassospira xiamenensis]|uniref:Uncharacterized protein n=1 Tax=Thalassospira xiamenensis TaxID=220697 RepID=A0ABR5XXL5_9PROT|nr:hypothetical protein AUP40_22045 [Thalassospira xiamenensis]KZD03876.1 hypothetical protein AUP45_21925 [Thalassospira xiamenensis]
MPANDNEVSGTEVGRALTTDIRMVARAIGHQIAREHFAAWEKKERRAANDNSPATLGEEIKGRDPKG